MLHPDCSLSERLVYRRHQFTLFHARIEDNLLETFAAAQVSPERKKVHLVEVLEEELLDVLRKVSVTQEVSGIIRAPPDHG